MVITAAVATKRVTGEKCSASTERASFLKFFAQFGVLLSTSAWMRGGLVSLAEACTEKQQPMAFYSDTRNVRIKLGTSTRMMK
jgi:hypothetical protein